MPADDWEHDEDWTDDEEEDLDGGDASPCPECGAPVSELTDKCSKCGYWLTDADRRATRPREFQPVWVRITAVIALVAVVLTTIYAILMGFVIQ